MLTANLMACMDDNHLLAAAEQELDPLTTTDLERELLGRFESLINEKAEFASEIEVLQEYEHSASDLKALCEALIESSENTVAILKIISDAGIDSAAALQAELDLAKQFYSIAEDAGDTITRLSQLITGATA